MSSPFSLRHPVLLLPIIVLFPVVALACIWDYDTLRQERAGFPDTLELITGKFLRHSPEFYQWRIKDRGEKLRKEPNNLAYLDDLAVAYSKVGRTNEAIATIEAKEKIKPGLYETYANLGTFYILTGDLEKGLPYIDQALAINPDAHFGREKYQKWLVEYAISKRDKSGNLRFPLQDVNTYSRPNFEDFLDAQVKPGAHGPLDSEAVQAVLGMMRFANHDNPLVLEALGDLLAPRLAARAYYQASYQMKDAASRDAYRKLAAEASARQASGPTPPSPNIEGEFQLELADAKQWYDELRAKEIAWIRDGKDVEKEFDRLYYMEPYVKDFKPFERHAVQPHPSDGGLFGLQVIATIAASAVGLLVLGAFYVRRALKRRMASIAKPAPNANPV